MDILLLGVGLQGKAALYDLVKSPEVSSITAGDVNIDALTAYVAGLKTNKVTSVQVDVTDLEHVSTMMGSNQAIIVLLPPEFRSNMAHLAVEKGIHFIDTSYALPEFTDLGGEAESKGVALLPEFGLDPGIDLVLAGCACRELDEVHELFAYGTGVPEPESSDNPLRYKISWTFSGVLDAYMRPARILTNGQIVNLSPSEIFDENNIHHVGLEGLGVMEAYPNGDAIKYLDVFDIAGTVQNSGRYSLRWPGHAIFWKKLIDLGFLEDKPVKVGNDVISPRKFVHDLLAPQLQYNDRERDIAAIRIEARGLKQGKRVRIEYQMIDRKDRDTGLLAMQRTVGFTASIGAQMILRGDIRKRGLLMSGRDVPGDLLIKELNKRGIQIQRRETIME